VFLVAPMPTCPRGGDCQRAMEQRVLWLDVSCEPGRGVESCQLFQRAGWLLETTSACLLPMTYLYAPCWAPKEASEQKPLPLFAVRASREFRGQHCCVWAG
jgi:hypothetical protein